MNIISNDMIELTRSDYNKYILSIYDVYGHYIDEITLSKDDLIEIRDSLNKCEL